MRYPPRDDNPMLLFVRDAWLCAAPAGGRAPSCGRLELLVLLLRLGLVAGAVDVLSERMWCGGCVVRGGNLNIRAACRVRVEVNDGVVG